MSEQVIEKEQQALIIQEIYQSGNVYNEEDMIRDLKRVYR